MKNLTHLKLQLSDSCEHTFADLSSFQSCLMKLPKLQAFCFDCTNCILLINQYPYSTLTSSISQCKTLKEISIKQKSVAFNERWPVMFGANSGPNKEFIGQMKEFLLPLSELPNLERLYIERPRFDLGSLDFKDAFIQIPFITKL